MLGPEFNENFKNLFSFPVFPVVCMCTMYGHVCAMCGGCWGWNRMLETLELVTEMIVSCHVGAENWRAAVVWALEPSLQPLVMTRLEERVTWKADSWGNLVLSVVTGLADFISSLPCVSCLSLASHLCWRLSLSQIQTVFLTLWGLLSCNLWEDMFLFVPHELSFSRVSHLLRGEPLLCIWFRHTVKGRMAFSGGVVPNGIQWEGIWKCWADCCHYIELLGTNPEWWCRACLLSADCQHRPHVHCWNQKLLPPLLWWQFFERVSC